MKLLFSLLFLSPIMLFAQNTPVSHTPLGISFEIPAGWNGIQSVDNFILTSESSYQAIMVIANPVKNEEWLRTIEERGFSSEGEEASQVENIDRLNDQMVAVLFKGKVDPPINGNSDISYYVISIDHPYAIGILLIASVAKEDMDEEVKGRLKGIAKSMKFFEPSKDVNKTSWENIFADARLIYMGQDDLEEDYEEEEMEEDYDEDDYSEEDYSEEDYSEEEYAEPDMFEVNLFSDGKFCLLVKSPMDQKTKKGVKTGKGKWKIQQNEAEEILQLVYVDGKTVNFNITSGQGGSIFLDEARCFKYMIDNNLCN